MDLCRRNLAIPLTFLCALAQGMWIGAGWHARSVSPSADTGCLCAYILDGKPANKVAAPVLAQSPAHGTRCAICDLGMASPDFPVAFAFSHADLNVEIRNAAKAWEPDFVSACVLPPGRAPPVL